MDETLFFARFYGGLYIILGLLSLKGQLLRKTIDRAQEVFFTTVTGYVTLSLGLATVVLHQVWVVDWPVISTVLGWSTLIKGIMKTGFPEYIGKHAQAFRGKEVASAVVLVLLGMALLLLSFLR